MVEVVPAGGVVGAAASPEGRSGGGVEIGGGLVEVERLADGAAEV